MAYIGKEPNQKAVRNRFYYTATGGETSLSSTQITNFAFEDGAYVDVSLNGIALVAGTDYNTTTANTIGGLEALTASDVVEILVYEPFSVFSGNVNGDFTINGDLSVDTDTLHVDSTNDRVGIGTTSPANTLTVKGGSHQLDIETTSTGVTLESIDRAALGDSSDMAYYARHANHQFFTGAYSEQMRITNTGNVGIGTTSPQTRLFVGDGSGTEGITIYSGTTGEGQLRFADGTSGSALYQGRIEYNHSTSKLNFGAGGATPMALDSGGNLALESSSDPISLTLRNTSNTSGFIIKDFNGNEAQLINADNGPMVFKTNDTEAMRIDSSQNLLVGKTSNDYSTEGAIIRPDGDTLLTRDGTVLTVRRNTTNGTLANFRKDATNVGYIGFQSTGFYIDGEGGHAGIRFAGNELSPRDNGADADGVVSLGESDKRWKDLYLSGGAYLGGTGSANHLDDYEEGTWTPTVSRNTTAPSFVYQNQIGQYTKIGRFCHVRAFVRIGTITSDGSGTVSFGGLPFTSNTNEGGSLLLFRLDGIRGGASGINMITSQMSGTNINLYNLSSTGVISGYSANPVLNGYVIFSAVYQTT